MTKKETKNSKEPITLGMTLKNAREKSDLTVEQVSLKTKIREDNILAIENDDTLDHIPHTYYRGYVSCYAKLLGLSSEPILSMISDVDQEAPKIAYSTGNSFQMKQNLNDMDSSLNKTHSKKRLMARSVALGVIILLSIVLAVAMWPLPHTSSEQQSEHRLDSIINIS